MARKEDVALQVATGLLASRKWLWGKETRFCYSHAIIADAYSVPGTVLGSGATGVNEFLLATGIRALPITTESSARQV